MRGTLVIQSHHFPLPFPWLESCLASVREWCVLNKYEYCFMADELFDLVPPAIMAKTQSQKVIASDLARLFVLQDALDRGYETVLWLDADFLIFNPSEFVIPDEVYALGREVWVQQDRQGNLKVYKKVHNAFLMFHKANPFLDFYTATAQRLLLLNQGSMPPQFIGPKLLTALHNVAALPVMERAGMLSPLVIEDIIRGEGSALDLFIDHSSHAIAGANLCISSCEKQTLTQQHMEQLISTLMEKGTLH